MSDRKRHFLRLVHPDGEERLMSREEKTEYPSTLWELLLTLSALSLYFFTIGALIVLAIIEVFFQ